MHWTIKESSRIGWRVLYRHHSLKELGWVIIVILLVKPCLGNTQTLPEVAGPTLTLRELVDGYKRDQSAILYSQCSVEDGKGLLVVSPKLNEIWYYEFRRGWHVNSVQVVIKDNGFDFTYGLGGIYSRERMRHIIQALLRTPFEFLMPDQLDRMLTSKSSPKCPELDPNELYRSK